MNSLLSIFKPFRHHCYKPLTLNITHNPLVVYVLNGTMKVTSWHFLYEHKNCGYDSKRINCLQKIRRDLHSQK